jgi:hypothetical protein
LTKDKRRRRIGLLGCSPLSHTVHLDGATQARHSDAAGNPVLIDRPLGTTVDQCDVAGPTLSSEDDGAFTPVTSKKSYRWPFCLIDQ